MADILKFVSSNPVDSSVLSPGENFSAAQKGISGKGKVIFYSTPFAKDGYWQGLSVEVTAERDVQEVINAVKENGGLWSQDSKAFIPWPCAVIEIELEAAQATEG